jgi:hypothetical protein
MKRGWFIFAIVVVLVYIFGMIYYDSRVKNTNFSPPGSCRCSYNEGDFFSNSMIVIDIKKDTCIATDMCTRGYCIIEYGNPLSSERFTSTVLCR